MEDLTSLQERLRQQRPVDWEHLPDFSLYMDQVLSYMDRQVLRFDDSDALTAAMANNYTKSGLVPRAEGKRYHREHLAYLTGICVLKHVLSTRDMDMLIREELAGNLTVEEGYNAFCDSLDHALNTIADTIDNRPEEDNAANAAISLALLSYAAGMASNRYIARLRAEKEASGELEPSKTKKKGKKD